VVLYQEPSGGAVPDVYQGEAGEQGKLEVWGPSRQQKKLAIIEPELQKLVLNSLDGLQVFHTFFRHRVAPLEERTRLMWEYSGPTDPDRTSLEELSKDEVRGYLGRAL